MNIAITLLKHLPLQNGGSPLLALKFVRFVMCGGIVVPRRWSMYTDWSYFVRGFQFVFVSHIETKLFVASLLF